jgi:hypothetical protein
VDVDVIGALKGEGLLDLVVEVERVGDAKAAAGAGPVTRVDVFFFGESLLRAPKTGST